jgi:hypothetical protein
MKRLLRPETLFFLALWLILLVAFRERGFYDPGSLWHVKVGEIILTDGMPRTDPFSYTFAGQRWMPQQWGAEVLMALVHERTRLDGLLLAFATGTALLFTLIFRRCLHGGMGWPLAALVVGGCLFVGAFHYYVRPHMFTIALLGWTMMCVVDYERGRCTEWRLTALIPLFVLWTNLHGGVLGGVMTLGLAVAGWGVIFLLSGRTPTVREGVGISWSQDCGDKGGASEIAKLHPLPDGRGSPIKSWRTAILLAAIVVACLLTPFVNPHGLEMMRIWQRIVGSKVLPEVISEHMPMDPTRPLGIAVMALGAFYLVVLAGALPTVRVSWLIPLVWFGLSFKGIRQGPLFAIVAAVAIADIWRHTIWHRLLVKHGDGTMATDSPKPEPAGASWWAIPAFAVIVSLTLQLGGRTVPVIGAGWARLDPDFVPTDLNNYVYKQVNQSHVRLFNDANLGGYLIYHAPKVKIFMDDRCELYGDDWIKAYSDTLGLPPEEFGREFERWADRWGFDHAFIMTNPPEKERSSIERYLLDHPEKWREVARGKRAAMFERVK